MARAEQPEIAGLDWPHFCAWPRCGCTHHDCDRPSEPIGADRLTRHHPEACDCHRCADLRAALGDRS